MLLLAGFESAVLNVLWLLGGYFSLLGVWHFSGCSDEAISILPSMPVCGLGRLGFLAGEMCVAEVLGAI